MRRNLLHNYRIKLYHSHILGWNDSFILKMKSKMVNMDLKLSCVQQDFLSKINSIYSKKPYTGHHPLLKLVRF
jgi:hypothetical protein